ncbi:response regulator of RpoS [compost metagenome]
MNEIRPAPALDDAVLLVDGDIVSRHAIAGYLRHCGYRVVEAFDTNEAMKALAYPSLVIDVIVCDVGAGGDMSGFELACWVRRHRPGIEVRLAASPEGVARTAAGLCEIGPHLHRPYEPQSVANEIRSLRAARDRA